MAKKESYEEMMNKLQVILENLERDTYNLEGVKLVNKIYKTLDSYEGKISVIKEEKEMEFKDSDRD